MSKHVIVEVEEGSLVIAVGIAAGRKTRIVRCVRVPLTDLGRDGIVTALRGLDDDVLEGVKGVHVVLGDRRVQHAINTVPRMAVGDVAGFLVREALRLTGMNAESDVLVAPRMLRRLPGGRLVIGTTTLARHVWEPIDEGLRAVGLEVLSLHSMEACLALAAKGEFGNRTVVIECNGGRARFVMCDGSAPVQVRRILTSSGGEGDSGLLVAQLAMELPRTIDWLVDMGLETPTHLLIGTRVNIDDESIAMIRGDLQFAERARPYVHVEAGQALPGLAVTMLVQSIVEAKPLPSLLAKPVIHLPWGATRLVGIAATAVAGLACSWSAVVDWRCVGEAKSRIESAAAEGQQINDQIAAIVRATAAATAEVPGDARLQAALRMRRPSSRLLAEISNCAGDAVHLEELKFSSTEQVVLAGTVQAATRQTALAAIAAYSKQLRTMPYLAAGGQEEIGEDAEHPNRFRFRFSMSWRNP